MGKKTKDKEYFLMDVPDPVFFDEVCSEFLLLDRSYASTTAWLVWVRHPSDQQHTKFKVEHDADAGRSGSDRRGNDGRALEKGQILA
jgi:hypothetical protein